MLASLGLILLCQLIGEAVVRGLGLPLPGPVLGLLLLLILLLARDRFALLACGPLRNGGVETASKGLLAHLSLLFVPAHDARKREKALASGADALILDLEDSVPEAEKAGAQALEACMASSITQARQGSLYLMCGGKQEVFERAKPVLLAIGPKVTRIGGNGLACQMKIAVNLLLMVEVVCFGEAVALAEKGGVSREAAVDAILKSVAASPVLGYRGPFILDGKMPEVPLADVTLQQKDMLLALNLARQLGSPTPLAAAANEMMNACRGLGIDGNDFVVAHEVYRRLGGQNSGGKS